MMLNHAFKEWAVICAALAEGRQALILRKGGIAEEQGDFFLEHRRFWLFPTYVHQQQHDGIVPEARPLLTRVESERPAPNVVRLTHWADVTGVYRIHDEILALMLGHLHLWSEETVRKRFAYRTPGLHVLSVRVYRAPQPSDILMTPAYEGCKSWVTLDTGHPTEGSVPVLDDAAFHDLQHSLDLLLNPTALA